MPVTRVRLKRLKPSASTSNRIPSLIRKRREMRMSRYQMFGCLRVLRSKSAKRDAPPEPLTPPPGVLADENPNRFGVIEPERLAVARAPDMALKIGANVQPLKMARPTALSFRLAKSVL